MPGIVRVGWATACDSSVGDVFVAHFLSDSARETMPLPASRRPGLPMLQGRD